MSEEDIELAEAYHRNKLDETARQKVESRAQADEPFSQLLHETGAVLAGLRTAGREELKELLSKWEKEHPVKKVIPLRRWLSLGIAAVLVIAAGIWYGWPVKTTPDTLALFREYYKPYPNVVMPITRSSESDSSAAAAAYGAYERGEYETAIDLFNKLPQGSSPVAFYLGQCYLAMDQSDQAIAHFITSMQQSENFMNQAQWYLSLAYLNQGDKQKAREVLERVASEENSFASDAKALLKRL